MNSCLLILLKFTLTLTNQLRTYFAPLIAILIFFLNLPSFADDFDYEKLISDLARESTIPSFTHESRLNKGDDSVNTCSDRLWRVNNLTISKYFSKKSNLCFLSIQPFNKNNLTYRSYLFTDDGSFNIFNSYGMGPASLTTASRDYMIFPRLVTYPAFRIRNNSSIEITTTSQHQIIIDSDTTEILQMSDAKILFSSAVNKKNNGGLEIKLQRGLLLDSGFAIGRSPTENRQGLSVFIDKNGERCVLKNVSIYKYRNNDVDFDLNDEQLKYFLKRNCPKLSF